MKPLTVALVVVFNLSVVVLYSRGLPAKTAASKAANPQSIAERSASSAYPGEPVEKEASPAPSDAPAEVVAPSAAVAEETKAPKAEVALEPVLARDGKETIDPKDGKEVQPVAVGERPLALRMPLSSPSRELLPGSSGSGGVLAPPNRANLDPPIVSPEAR